MIDWSVEWPLVRDAANKFGIDPYFVAAVRVAENGGPGREFGVVSVVASTYEQQLRVCCETIRHRLFEIGASIDWMTKSGYKRRIYSDNTIQYIARRYAPIGAENDPSTLNVNWYNNVRDTYHRFSDQGGVCVSTADPTTGV